MKKGIEIQPANGKLGVLTPGMGAVATTFVAGVYAVRKGLGKPIGSLTQMGTIRLGKRTDMRIPMIRDFVPLSELENLVFGGWDIFEDDMYAAAVSAGVLDRQTLDGLKTELENVLREAQMGSRLERASADYVSVSEVRGTRKPKPFT